MKNKQKKWILFFLMTSFLLKACGKQTGKATNGKEEVDQLAKIKENGKLVVGTSPDFPPSEFYILGDDGKKEIVGSDISLAKAIADEIGVTIDIKATDFNGVLANIQSGSVDFGISGFVGTDERGQIMDFSDGYQQEASDGYQGLLVTKEIAETYPDLDSFKKAKLTLGAQGGSIQFEIAQKLTDTKKYQTIWNHGCRDLSLKLRRYSSRNRFDVFSRTVIEHFPRVNHLASRSV